MTISTVNIPQGWQKIRLKRIANLHPSKSEVTNLPDDIIATFLPMEAVSESWEVDYSRKRPLAEIRSGYTYFRDGDILVAKITPCFENGKGALVNGCLNGFGFGTTEFHVIRSPNSATTRFLSYVVRSHRFKFEGAGMMTGTAGQKRLSDDYVKDFEVFLPPMMEREKIASFLDRKTATIDTVIAKKQRLIQLLEEKRTALIDRAVTKGLNPNAPMKESGISWIGKIPEHWQIVKLSLKSRILNGTTPDRLRLNYWQEGTVPWVSSGEVNEYIITKPTAFITEKALRECSLRLMPKGAVVIGMIGQGKTRGTSARLDIDACINQNIACIIPESDLNNVYLHQALIQAYEPIRELARGGNQGALNCELVGCIKIPDVDFAEELVEMGVPRTDIVLGFHSPLKRQFSKYAVN